MKALKWNYKTHKYEDYKLPEGCILITDLEKVVSCAECGTKHEYGTMYTSRKIHNCMGFGFPVCLKCYKKELSEVQNDK